MQFLQPYHGGKKGEQWAKLWLKLERIKEFCSGWLERGINLAPCSPDNAPISTLKCRLLRILPATNRELVLYYRGFWSQWASVTFEEAGEGREQAATAPRKIKINLRERGDDSGEQKCRLAEKEEHKMVLGAMRGRRLYQQELKPVKYGTILHSNGWLATLSGGYAANLALASCSSKLDQSPTTFEPLPPLFLTLPAALSDHMDG